MKIAKNKLEISRPERQYTNPIRQTQPIQRVGKPSSELSIPSDKSCRKYFSQWPKRKIIELTCFAIRVSANYSVCIRRLEVNMTIMKAPSFIATLSILDNYLCSPAGFQKLENGYFF